MVKRAPTCRSTAARRRSPSIVRTLIQTGVLAVLLVPFGTVAMEADAITCGFGSYYYDTNDGCGTGDDQDTKIFDFGDYFVKLTFGNLTDSFELTINDVQMNPSGSESEQEFANNFEDRDDSFEDYQCISLNEFGCVDFVVSGSPGSDENWDFYDITFGWFLDTNSEFPNGDGPLGQVRVLNNQGGDGSNQYTRDMCLLTGDGEGCTYFADGVIPGDPAVRTRDTDFSSFTVAWVAVPEPSTLLLLGVGVAGVLGRRRSARPESRATH